MSKKPNRRTLYLLLAGLLRDKPEAGQAPWHEPDFWQEMVQLADLNGVTTALPLALRRTDLWGTIPGNLKDYLEAVHELNTQREAAQISEALTVHDVLTRAGIPCVFLKGTAYLLSGLFAEDAGRRLTTDIDVLVPRESIAKAEDALVALGYNAANNETWPNLDRRHHIPALLPARGQGQFSVELHVRPVKFPWDSFLPPGDIFERAQFTSVEGRPVRLPSSRDMLMHALIHAASADSYHGRRIPLRDAVDINRLWTLAKTDQTNLLLLLDETKQRRLSNYLDACLRLQSKEETKPANGNPFNYYRQVLFRSGFKGNLANWLIANWLFLVRHPRIFLQKKSKRLIDPEFYRILKSRLRHRRK